MAGVKKAQEGSVFLDPLGKELLASSLRKLGLSFDALDTQSRLEVDSFAIEFLNALAHPTRMKIVRLLKSGPQSVNSIIEVMKIPQANASQHLATLLKAGIVARESRGTMRFYSLKNSSIGGILDVIEEIWFQLNDDQPTEKME